jgi:uncharacterized protein YbjT (DUF2867 family)
MADPAPIATVFGGSGFVGRYIVQRLANAGWRVRVAVRRPNEALFVRSYGTVGQVEPIQANIRDDVTVRRAVEGADAVVNCVGILVAQGRQDFDSVQAEGAGRIARIAAHRRVRKLVHVSAIGADPHSESAYARSKAEGEAAVQSAFPSAVILRPSIIFGTEDGFFNRFAAMARLSPILPIVGPDTRFQPVYVDDVAAAASESVLNNVAPGIYELGGPEVLTFRELMQRMLEVIGRRRAIVSLPWPVARLQASILDVGQRLTGGLFTNTLITKDQVKLLERDNVVSEGVKGFPDLGIKPTAMLAVLESYLHIYRPQGQFTETTASAANLRQE